MTRKKTVLVTGGSGFIAKHIIRQLLDEGFDVRASVRSAEREQEVISAVGENVKESVDVNSQLSFVHLDLSLDDGWADALDGMAALIHTASPFPMNQPDNEDEHHSPRRRRHLASLKSGQGGRSLACHLNLVNCCNL